MLRYAQHDMCHSVPFAVGHGSNQLDSLFSS